MNERIKDLAEQAFFETEYDDVQDLRETMERFAELIVKECAAYAFSDDQDHKTMLNHFGVEE